MPEIQGKVGHGIERARQLTRDPVFREVGLLAPAGLASIHIPGLIRHPCGVGTQGSNPCRLCNR